MRIGVFANSINTGTIDDVVNDAKAAAADGFSSFWCPQIFGLDALTVLAIIGREVPVIELGTSVVPTYPRHPWVMAQQALTTQAASGGRLCLGIGLSHQVVIESMWGLDFAKPVRHMKEYLSILLPLVRGEAAAFTGETLSANGALDVHGSSPFPVVVAALGTQMLQLTGRVADGTYTWCVGPDTLASHIIPTISAAAEAAERPTPRIIAGLPVCVTDDPAAVQAQVAKEMVMYGYLPSYRAMMDREGVAGPADLAIVGTASEVTDRLGHLAEIGVTDFAAVEAGTNPDEIANTRAALRSLL